VTLTHSDKHRIADKLLGTCSSGYALADEHRVDVAEIEPAARECGVARCSACDFWCPTTELDKDDRCEDCTQ
jgi:hypothetical protein